MARKELFELARRNVKSSSSRYGGELFLAVNPRFQWKTRAKTRYVDAGAAEVPAAEEAIWEALKRERGAIRLPLQEWVLQERDRAGGLPQLAARLLGIPLPATHKERRANKPYAAELRKLQEYASGKYHKATGARRERIEAYGGPGNPYAAPEALNELLEGLYIAVAVMGNWQISKDYRVYQLKHTDAEPIGNLAVDQDGRGLCEHVAENAIDEPMQLLDVYSLEIEWSE